MSALDHLIDTLKVDIAQYEWDSDLHRRQHRLSQRAAFVLMFLTTVMSGAGLILPSDASSGVLFGVLCLTVATTSVTAWGEMGRAREHWQQEQGVLMALQSLLKEVEFTASYKPLAAEDLQLYFKRLMDITGNPYRMPSEQPGLVGAGKFAPRLADPVVLKHATDAH